MATFFLCIPNQPQKGKWRIIISLFDVIAWSVGVYPVSKVDKPDIESESEFLNSNDIISISFTISHLWKFSKFRMFYVMYY